MADRAQDDASAPAATPRPERRGSFTVGSVRGIPIRLHWTFLLVLPLFAYFMAHGYFRGAPGEGPGSLGYFWGAVLAVALFVSVLLHELGHSLTALRYGLKVRSITLLPIGGVSAFEKMITEPRKEFWVTAAGPAVNFAIGGPILAAWALDLIPVLPARAHEAIFWLGFLNVVLGAFNLLVPAFPMDGGRVLRSLLSARMGLRRGTEVAASVGRTLAFLMGLWGALTFAAGGWLLLLIAFFIFAGATQEEQAVRLTDTLGHLTVADVMTPHVHTVPADRSVEEAFQEMLRTKHLVLPVMENGGLVALLHLEDLARVPAAEQAYQRVGDIARKELYYADPGMAASEALETITNNKGEPLLVMRGHDLLGILTRTDLMRAAQILEVSRHPPRASGRVGGGRPA